VTDIRSKALTIDQSTGQCSATTADMSVSWFREPVVLLQPKAKD
jgi:hypothetical protein